MIKKLDDHLRQLVAEPDYAKRDYDVSRMIEALAGGKRMIDLLSVALAQ